MMIFVVFTYSASDLPASTPGIPSLKQGALINANIDGVDQRLVTIALINGSKKPVDQRYCHQPLINSLIFCVDQHIEICC